MSKGKRRLNVVSEVENVPLKTGKSRARTLRRGFPIHAYIGANGGGKSLAAVYDSLPTLAAGRPIASTVRLLDPATGEPHPLWVPLSDYKTLLDVEFCDVILDEVTGVASSRDSMSMPTAVANHLVQLRRRDVALRWTAPNWKRADTIIRECSQAATLCIGLVKQTVQADDGTDRQWSSRRLFYWRTYDSVAFDEWSAYRKERLRPVARQLYRRDSTDAARAYDTFDSVLTLGAVTEGGSCMDCGGSRPRPKCRCGDAPTKSAGPLSTLVDIPETDDTPAVTVELPTVPALGAVTFP